MLITLYHGTNNDARQVAQFPRSTKAINGVGFYVTDDIEVAKKYGCNVVVWEVEAELVNKLGLIKQTIDQSWKEGLSDYWNCVEGGMEYILTQRQADELAIEAIEVGYYDLRSRFYTV